MKKLRRTFSTKQILSWHLALWVACLSAWPIVLPATMPELVKVNLDCPETHPFAFNQTAEWPDGFLSCCAEPLRDGLCRSLELSVPCEDPPCGDFPLNATVVTLAEKFQFCSDKKDFLEDVYADCARRNISQGACRVVANETAVKRFVQPLNMGIFVMGGLVGICLANTETLMKSLFVELMPGGKEAEYFGVRSFAMKFVQWLPPLIFMSVQELTARETGEADLDLGMVCAAVPLVFISLIILLTIDMDKGRRAILPSQSKRMSLARLSSSQMIQLAQMKADGRKLSAPINKVVPEDPSAGEILKAQSMPQALITVD